MGFLSFLKGKPAAPAAPAAGKWVEDTEEYYPNYYGAGMQTRGLGTFSWVGPNPANGVRPPNPATTPEYLAQKEQNRQAKAASNAAYAKSQADRRKAQEEKAEEERVCQEACDKAIADLRASRANAGAAPRTRKRNTRKQRKTRSRSRR
jgi:hypothetical protein